MAGYTFSNFAISTIAGGAGGSGTSLNSGDLSVLLQTGDGTKWGAPSSTVPSFLMFGTITGAHEICKVTNVSTDTLTIVRGQESTSATTWAPGTPVQAVVTAGMMGGLLPNDGGTITTDGSGNLTAVGLALSAKVSKVANVTTAGNYGAPVAAASAKQTNITNTTLTSIAAYTPTADVLAVIYVTFRVGAGNTNSGVITANVTFTDGASGATATLATYGTTTSLSGATLAKATTYSCAALSIYAASGHAITVQYQNTAAGTISDFVNATILLMI